MQQISPWFQTAKLISGLRKTYSKMVAVRSGKHAQHRRVRGSGATFPDSADDKAEHGGS